MLHRFSGVIALSGYRRSSKKKDALQLHLPEFPIDGERTGSNPRQAVAHLSHVGERGSLHLLVFLHKGAFSSAECQSQPEVMADPMAAVCEQLVKAVNVMMDAETSQIYRLEALKVASLWAVSIAPS